MSWWESAYRSGHVNWDPGDYDRHLPWFLDRYQVRPGRLLDPGCGNGKSAVWLARQGFTVVGIDLAPSAVEQARRLARSRGVDDRASFYEGRFPDDLPGDMQDGPLSRESFDLIIERAFLQHLGHGAALHRTVDLLGNLLKPEGLFYSLMVAREGRSNLWGIVRWSRKEIEEALHPRFSILQMRHDVFTPGEPGSVPAWITVSKRT
jgi:SAM-dependent methyltransferase